MELRRGGWVGLRGGEGKMECSDISGVVWSMGGKGGW